MKPAVFLGALVVGLVVVILGVLAVSGGRGDGDEARGATPSPTSGATDAAAGGSDYYPSEATATSTSGPAATSPAAATNPPAPTNPPAATNTPAPPTPTSPPTGGALTITISGFTYSPNAFNAQAGQTANLTVRNNAGFTHTFTIDGVVDSGNISGGNSRNVSFTPTQPGMLTWYCSIHGQATMSGTITVS